MAIQCWPSGQTGWTPASGARHNRRMMPPRPPLTVVKLSDHFGQYVLVLKCECGHTRTAQPKTLAGLAGWDAVLIDVVKSCVAPSVGSAVAVPRFAPRRNAMGKNAGRSTRST